MFVDNYNKFLTNLILEHSRNDKIPELTWNKKRKTGIFLFGPPGVGKTTFVDNFLIPYLKNYKIFNSDNLIQKLKKIGKKLINDDKINQKLIDNKKILKILKNKYHIDVKLSDEEIVEILKGNEFIDNENLLINRMILFMKNSNADFIFDSTGNNPQRIEKLVNMAKENHYDIIFIKVYNDLKTTIYQNLNRDRKVEINYLFQSYLNASKNITNLKKLNPNNFYIYNVANNNFYETTKYIDFLNPTDNIFEELDINLKDNISYHGQHLKSCHFKKRRNKIFYFFQFKEDYDKFINKISKSNSDIEIENINRTKLAKHWNSGIILYKKQYR